MYLKGYITQAIASKPLLKRAIIPYKNQAISYYKYATANFHTQKNYFKRFRIDDINST